MLTNQPIGEFHHFAHGTTNPSVTGTGGPGQACTPPRRSLVAFVKSLKLAPYRQLSVPWVSSRRPLKLLSIPALDQEPTAFPFAGQVATGAIPGD